MATSSIYTVEAFIAEVQAILADEGVTDAGLSAIAERMKGLVARDDLYSGIPHKNMTDDMPSTRLHAEPDGSLSLSLAKFAYEEPTRVHNHNSWGVACIYKGVDRYTAWERVDDGSKAGHAELKAVKTLTMRRGDASYWLDPPGDMHSQWGQDGHAAWELVLMGRNIQGKNRLFFEPEQNQVWEAPVTELRSAQGGFRG